MDSEDEHEECSAAYQVLCIEWAKQMKKTMKVHKLELSKSDLKAMVGKKMSSAQNESLSSTENSEVEEETEEENQEKVKNTATTNVSPEKDSVKDADADLMDEFGMDDYSDEEFNVEKFDQFYEEISEAEVSDSEDEVDATTLRKGDNMLACAKCKPGSNVLEFYVYNHEDSDFYVLHHIDLFDAHPLCLKWMDFDLDSNKNSGEDENRGSTDKGSFVAVGTMESVVEIYDLSIMNNAEPDFRLGYDPKHPKHCETKESHQGAVLDLAWSQHKRKKLFSASADKTVALWDLQREYIVRRYRKHKATVQTIELRKDSADHLLSGAFNGTIYLYDVRTKCGPEVPLWKIKGEVERVCWNDQDNNYFAASNDRGDVHYFDTRKTGECLYSWKAHNKAVPALAIRPDSLLYSASSDGNLKAWKLNEKEATLEKARNLKMGMANCFAFNPDVESVFCVGGEKQGLRLMNTEKFLQGSTEADDEEDDDDEPIEAKSSSKQKKKKRERRHFQPIQLLRPQG